MSTKQVKRKTTANYDENGGESSQGDDNGDIDRNSSIVGRSLTSKRTKLRDSTEIIGNCGSVKSIRLKNFMCHSNLEFNFGDKMNLVVGRNGSGKSAILAGLVIGLGGKATQMNRGRALREYVKNGCQTSEISIVLQNKGSDAFQPSKYGENITVERKLSANGAGSYKLKDEKGRLVSEKREDLVRMLDHFNVQLDNPITILSQDVSRQFLQSATPQKLYNFFMRSTQLEQMRDDLITITENTVQAFAILQNRSMDLPNAREQVKQLKSQIQRHESLQGLRDKIDELFKECAWAKVNYQKNVVSQYSDQVRLLENELKKFDDAKIDQTEKLDQLEQELVDLEARKNNFQTRCEESKSKYEHATREFQKKVEIHATKKNQYERIKKEIELQFNEDRELAKQIQEANEADHSERAKLRNEKTLHRDKLQQQIACDRQAFKSAEDDIEALINAKTGLQSDLADKKSELAAVERKLASVHDNINNLQRSKTNSLHKFGEQTPNLLRSVETAFKAGRFKKRPRGPIGAYVTVRDENWALAVEVCLGVPLLSAYVCDNFDDSKVLDELIKNCRPGFRFRPMIVTTNFGDEKPYDVNRNVPNCEFPNILSVLDIKDVIIRNVLIDQRGIESIVLIKEDERLREVMYKQPPARQAYSITGSQCFASPDFRYYSTFKENATFLAASVDESIKRLNVTEAQFSSSVQSLKAETSQINEKLSQLEMKYRTIKSNLDQIQRRMMKSEGDCRSLTREIDELVAENVDVELLENERTEVRNQLATLQNDLEEAKKALNVAEKDVTSARDERSLMKDELDRMRVGNEEERQRCSLILVQIKKQKEKLGKLNNGNREIDEKLKNRREELMEAEQQLEQLTNEAKILCEIEFQTQRDYETIENEIAKCQRRLEAGENEIGDIIHLKAVYDEKKTRLDKIENDINQLTDFLQTMELAKESRKTGYILMRGTLATQLRITFLIHLTNRNYCGKLLVSHKKKTIGMHVRTHNSASDQSSSEEDGNSSMRDLKGLSGGERSFSTISFILSLWQLMDAPFRCLDEFDVFMDMVSRQIAMDMIISFMEKFNVTSQFILLTPMNLNSLIHKHADKVSVFELESPRDNLSHGKRCATNSEDEEEEN